MIKTVLICCLSIFYLTNLYAKLPDWAKNASSSCKDSEICSSGSGNSLEMAKTDARNGIQRFFEVEVNSSFKNELSNNNNEVRENSYENLEESTKGILKGVKITKTYEDKSAFYALAVLKKETVIDELGFQINKLDKQMEVLLNDNSLASTKKLENLYEERERLNQKLLLVSGKKAKENISYKNIFDKKQQNKKIERKFFVDIKNEDIDGKIKQLLSDNGAIAVKSPDMAQTTIKAKVSNKKDFLNVKDFVKYTITFNVDIVKNGKIIHSINKKITDTGIDYDEIYASALNEFFDYLDDNFINLLD